MTSYFKKKYTFDIFITSSIIILIFLMYAYLVFPEIAIVKTPFFSFKSNHDGNVQSMMYHNFSKMHLILLISLIFLTTSNRWKFFLIPILIVAYYQVVGLLKDEGFGIMVSYFTALLLLIFNLVFLFFLDKKLAVFKSSFYNIIDIDLLQEIMLLKENEIKNQHIFQNIASTSNSNKTNDKKLYGELRNLQTVLYTNSVGRSNHLKSKENNRLDYIIALFLLIIPFMPFLFKLVPKGMDFLDFEFFKIQTPFNEAQIFVWFLAFKIVILILLSIWYITTNQIWRYAILMHIAVVALQVYLILNGAIHLDEKEIVYALPIILPLLALIFFLARWIKYRSKAQILNEVISERIHQIIEILNNLKIERNELIVELQQLRKNRNAMDEKMYYEKLNTLKLAVQREIQLN